MPSIQNLVRDLHHIGIPTNSIQATMDFYKSLGFEVIYNSEHKDEKVAFLKLGNIVIETYENHNATMCLGAIDNFALNVSDIENTYSFIQKLGFQALEKSIQTLPFFEHGERFFTIQGPNNEKVEFSQYL